MTSSESVTPQWVPLLAAAPLLLLVFFAAIAFVYWWSACRDLFRATDAGARKQRRSEDGSSANGIGYAAVDWAAAQTEAKAVQPVISGKMAPVVLEFEKLWVSVAPPGNPWEGRFLKAGGALARVLAPALGNGDTSNGDTSSWEVSAQRREVLSNISGWAISGEVTGLLGPSGEYNSSFMPINLCQVL